MNDARVHVVHLVHRLDTGGMENGLVHLVNRLPSERYRHTIVPLTSSGDMAARITNPEVAVEALGLRPGPLLAALPTLLRRIRALRPAIVHTRNVGTLEAQIAAALARVPVRVHGEHGWEVHDLVGSNASLLRTRRRMRRFVHHQIALSTPTFEYLRDRVGVPLARLSSICNGVDVRRFHPSTDAEARRNGRGSHAHDEADAPIVVGFVGRLADVKNPLLVVDAFERAHRRIARDDERLAARLRLEIVGDGPLASSLRDRVQRSPLRDAITLAGKRDDVAERMRSFDIYALPSLAEGISNTLLEAMASGLACIATRVGGNDELVETGASGTLVPSGDAQAFGDALAAYASDTSLRSAHAAKARERAVERFGLDRMVAAYDELYARLLVERRVVPAGWPAVRRAAAALHPSSAG